MRTRRLIAVALICGLAILVAGGIQLARIGSGRDERFEPLSVGQSAVVSGVTAEVVSASVAADEVVLEVRIDVPSDGQLVADPTGVWRLQVGGEPQARRELDGPRPCPDEPLEPGRRLECALAFARGRGTPYARFDLAGSSAVWVLESS